jgi:hypothetical protein
MKDAVLPVLVIIARKLTYLACPLVQRACERDGDPDRWGAGGTCPIASANRIQWDELVLC